MMTEKRQAKLVVLVAISIITAYALIKNDWIWASDVPLVERIRYAVEVPLWILAPFIFSWLPYVFVRGAAVTGGALASFSILLIFIAIDGGGWLLLLYLFWAIGAFLAALYPAIFRPSFFVRSEKRAVVWSMIFTTAGFGLGLLAHFLL